MAKKCFRGSIYDSRRIFEWWMRLVNLLIECWMEKDRCVQGESCCHSWTQWISATPRHTCNVSRINMPKTINIGGLRQRYYAKNIITHLEGWSLTCLWGMRCGRYLIIIFAPGQRKQCLTYLNTKHPIQHIIKETSNKLQLHGVE